MKITGVSTTALAMPRPTPCSSQGAGTKGIHPGRKEIRGNNCARMEIFRL